MKRPFSTAFLIFLSAVLVLFGVFYGAYQGWRAEAARVDALLKKDGGLNTMLLHRASDAANLEKVALRHMAASDPLLKALKDSRAAAADEKASLHSRFNANARLDAAAEAVEKALNALPSFSASERDTNYVSAILRDMRQLAASGAADEYNSAARDYNERLSRSLSGLLSRLIFNKPAQIFE